MNPFRTPAEQPPISISEIQNDYQREAYSQWCEFSTEKQKQQSGRTFARCTVVAIVLGTSAIAVPILIGNMASNREETLRSENQLKISTNTLHTEEAKRDQEKEKTAQIVEQRQRDALYWETAQKLGH